MAERAIFLDRDNTIIDNDGYLGDASRVKLLQGAATAIASLRRLGYRIIVVSNQSGVARGMFDESAVEAVNQEMCKQLREQAGAHIDASYYCPYHPEAVVAEYKLDHDWRKPKPGMLLQAAEDFNLDLAQSWMIGDQPRDVAAGASAGCRTILLKDPDHPAADADVGLSASPNFIVKSLADAARVVVREGRGPIKDPVPTPLNAMGLPIAEPVAAGASPAPAAATASDLSAVAEKIADRLARSAPQQENLRPVLEEMLSFLRQNQRARDIPEFSMGRMVATVLQVLVAVCFVVAAWQALSFPVTGSPTYFQERWVSLQLAQIWLLGGAVLQGAVVALHLMDRNR